VTFGEGGGVIYLFVMLCFRFCFLVGLFVCLFVLFAFCCFGFGFCCFVVVFFGGGRSLN